MLPAYIRIHDAIKQKIDQEFWKVGQRLPSERDLSETYHVSRMTLRQAISILVDEGILERKIGSGTFVARQRVQEIMTGTTSFSEIISNQGKQPSSKLISYQKKIANETEIEKLQLQKGDIVVRMERVRYADNIPIVYEVAAVPEKIIKTFKKEEVTDQFFKTLRLHGHEIEKSQQTIYAKTAGEALADLLEIKKGKGILCLTQISYFTDGKPFEYVKSQYVGDRFEFYFES